MTPTQALRNDDTVCICGPLVCTYCGRRDWRPKVPGDECFLCGHPLAVAEMPAAGCRAHADVDRGAGDEWIAEDVDDVGQPRLAAPCGDCGAAGEGK